MFTPGGRPPGVTCTRSCEWNYSLFSHAAAIASVGPLRGLHDSERAEAQELPDDVRVEESPGARLTDAVQELVDASPVRAHGRSWHSRLRDTIVTLASYLLSQRRTF